jgi:hypothetical protein
MANDADEEHHPIRRRGRFIAPTADVSAPVAVPISRLFCETPLSALNLRWRLPCSVSLRSVTLSAAKGLPRLTSRCFAALSMTKFLSMTMVPCHPERSEESPSVG